MTKRNYHTHTFRCHHAVGTEDEYVQAAIRGGFSLLGFSDHCPWPFASGFVSHIRMTVEQLPDYVSTVLALKEKYKNQIEIQLGLECEYFPRYETWLRETIDQYQLDYVLFGAHYPDSEECTPYIAAMTHTDEGLHRYEQNVLAGMETGLYKYLCHPDLFCRSRRGYLPFNRTCRDISETICKRALELHIPLEYNLNGDLVQKSVGYPVYPRQEFWDIAHELGNEVILGVDAHDPGILENVSLWNSAQGAALDLPKGQ